MGSEFESYVCTECGYFENYITDKAKLQEVQQKWAKVAKPIPFQNTTFADG